MKNILKRVGALAMTAALSVSLIGGALAYSTPDFTDVVKGNWAYESVMKMADAGVIKGTGGSTFAPEVKVSPAMWLTLVGRAVYEADVKAATTAADNWFTAYVRVAQAKGLTTGTNVTDANIEGEITRYDMAATVYAAVKLLGAKDATVDTTAIKDYGDIPQKYLAAVGQMYATGLIKGDSAGSFNGNNTMRRDEAATVMSRLIDYKAKLAETPAEPEKPTTPTVKPTGETTQLKIKGKANTWDGTNGTLYPAGINLVLYYKDGTELGRTVTVEDGLFEFDLTIDKAYYDYYDICYFIDGTYTNSDGVKYSNLSKRTGHVQEESRFNLWESQYNKGVYLTANDPYNSYDF